MLNFGFFLLLCSGFHDFFTVILLLYKNSLIILRIFERVVSFSLAKFAHDIICTHKLSDHELVECKGRPVKIDRSREKASEGQ